MNSEYFTSELQREVIECEGYLHNWKSAEFQKCLFNHVGTNEMSLKFQELFSEKNALEKGRSKIKIFSIYFTVSILALYKSGSASFDIGSDAAVLAKYHPSNIDESIVSNCTRLEDLEEINQSWTISSDHCFWLQLVPMLIPCLLNVIEVGSFIKRNQASVNIKTKNLCIDPISSERFGENYGQRVRICSKIRSPNTRFLDFLAKFGASFCNIIDGPL